MRGLQFITGDFNGEPTGRCNCTILATDDTQEMTISLVGDEEESFCLDITTENIERCLHSPKEIKKLLPNIVTTPRVQLIGSALQIAHEIKLNKADIYPDAIIGRAEIVCQGSARIRQTPRFLHFIERHLEAVDADPLIENNKICYMRLFNWHVENWNKETTFESGRVETTFEKYYIPYIPLMDFHTEVGDDTKTLWKEIKREKNGGRN